MKKDIYSYTPALLIMILTSIIFPGCEFIGDVFKAGIWVGIAIIILILVIVGLIIKMFKK
jgi:hypothetical protein